MNDLPFSQLVRSRRKRLGLTQAEIESRIGLPQSTYSHWETGTRLPDAGRPELRALGECLDIPHERIVHALELQENAGNLRTQFEQFLSLEDFLSEQQSYLADSLSKVPTGFSIEIWLVGPESLPVSQNVMVKDTWVNNLSIGINYKIIWLLDLLDYKRQWSVIDDMTAALDEIAQALSGSRSGGIYHYPTSAFFGSRKELEVANDAILAQEFTKNVDLYNTIKGRNLKGNTFYDIKLLGSSGVRQKLFRYATAVGALAIYCPYARPEDGQAEGGTPIATGVAGIPARASFTRQHNGTATTTWLEREAQDLRTLVVEFEALWTGSEPFE